MPNKCIIAVVQEAATFEDAEVDAQKKFGAIIVLCQHNFLKIQLKDY